MQVCHNTTSTPNNFSNYSWMNGVTHLYGQSHSQVKFGISQEYQNDQQYRLEIDQFVTQLRTRTPQEIGAFMDSAQIPDEVKDDVQELLDVAAEQAQGEDAVQDTEQFTGPPPQAFANESSSDTDNPFLNFLGFLWSAKWVIGGVAYILLAANTITRVEKQTTQMKQEAEAAQVQALEDATAKARNKQKLVASKTGITIPLCSPNATETCIPVSSNCADYGLEVGEATLNKTKAAGGGTVQVKNLCGK